MAECTFKSDEELLELWASLIECPKPELSYKTEMVDVVYPDGSRKLVKLESATVQYKQPEVIPSSNTLGEAKIKGIMVSSPGQYHIKTSE